VFLLYTMRRVDCRRCGAIVVEEVPWGDGKRTLTKAYMLFLARWARRLSWKETAEAFRTSWEKVFDAVEHIVIWGLEHRTLGQIDAIGVDEIQYAKGHKYLTLVYQIDIGITRLLCELSVSMRDATSPQLVPSGLRPDGRKEDWRWAGRQLMFRTACAGFMNASPDGGSRIPGAGRFRKPCGRRLRGWPENTGYSEPPRC
jgi:hypothetical protein